MATTTTQIESLATTDQLQQAYQEALEAIPTDAITTTLLLFDARQKRAAAEAADRLGHHGAADALRADADLYQLLHYRLQVARHARVDLDGS